MTRTLFSTSLLLCSIFVVGRAMQETNADESSATPRTRLNAPSHPGRAGLQARVTSPYAATNDPIANRLAAQYPPPLRDPEDIERERAARPVAPPVQDEPVGSGLPPRTIAREATPPAIPRESEVGPVGIAPAELDEPAGIGTIPAGDDAVAPLDTPLGPVEQDELAAESTVTDEGAPQTEADTSELDGDADTVEAAPRTRQPETLSPEMQERRDRIRHCLARYYREPVRTSERSPWGVMHALIAYGVDTEIYVDNQRVNAIGWLCWNGPCHGMRLFYTSGGRIQTRQGPGVEGHEGQFLAMLAQSRVRSDYEMRIDGYEFTVADLIEHEKRTCKSGTELTFKLIALSHYLPSDATWTCDRGEEWNIPRLIAEELDQPVNGAACGGTHRMMGFSYAVHKRQKRNEPMTGQWLRAKKYVDAYIDYTFELQNEDGSFSTNWFKGRGDWGDADRRLETTGHILEWLVFSLPEEQLQDPRVLKAVDFLTDLMLQHQRQGWNIGPRGHALHALAIYDERVFDGQPGERAEQLARALREDVR